MDQIDILVDIKKQQNKKNMEEIRLLEKLYAKKDEGYVEMYCNRFKDELKCISKENKSHYNFNDTINLWELKKVVDIIMA